MNLPRARTVVLAVAAAALASSCGGGGEGRTVISAGDGCGHDQTSTQAEVVVERVGGLRTDAWSVGLATSTRGGVVALVSGDVERAFDELHGEYGVSIVARDAHRRNHAAGLAQVRRLVDIACAPSSN